MNHTRPISPADRDRAVARLRSITAATTLAGIAAVGGFGTVAWVSYDGAATAGPVTAALTASGTGTSSTAGTSTDTSTTTSTTITTGTPAPTAASTRPTPTVAPATTGAHASTGGS